MQITIGVQNSPREVTAELDGTADKIAKDVLKALETGNPIDLTDAKGRRVMVPAGAVAYVELGSDEVHRVGFNV